MLQKGKKQRKEEEKKSPKRKEKKKRKENEERKKRKKEKKARVLKQSNNSRTSVQIITSGMFCGEEKKYTNEIEAKYGRESLIGCRQAL